MAAAGYRFLAHFHPGGGGKRPVVLICYAGAIVMKTKGLMVLALAGALPGEVLFKADFETGDLSQWSQTGTRGQNATPRNIQVVTDVVRQGKYAAKVTIHADDVFNDKQLRAQLGGPRVTVQEGSDTYLSFWLYMAEAPKDRDNFFYWEGNPPPRDNNVMTWWVRA